jgi:hypothetical protein
MMKAGLQFTRDRERANACNEIRERLNAALQNPSSQLLKRNYVGDKEMV